jgi:hypothetical protein
MGVGWCFERKSTGRLRRAPTQHPLFTDKTVPAENSRPSIFRNSLIEIHIDQKEMMKEKTSF